MNRVLAALLRDGLTATGARWIASTGQLRPGQWVAARHVSPRRAPTFKRPARHPSPLPLPSPNSRAPLSPSTADSAIPHSAKPIPRRIRASGGARGWDLPNRLATPRAAAPVSSIRGTASVVPDRSPVSSSIYFFPD
ncbi:hypothetical protein PVAP13_1NG065950 [Panicum virgatum]|uniref:Uncharacterized protein n=1 Tax=Panicum virgatum TaxID=38727 RepID=A0A8T0WGU4_PANVG|nr:hypothetical protein PVAP13_1NG065950 [Panicum virgatum]